MTQKMLDQDQIDNLANAIFSMGSNFLQQGKFEKALIIFDGLMALFPDNAQPALAYGETLLRAGKQEEASMHFSAFFDQFDIDSKSIILAAKARLLIGEHDQARNLLLLIIGGQVQASQEDLDLVNLLLIATATAPAHVDPIEN